MAEFCEVMNEIRRMCEMNDNCYICPLDIEAHEKSLSCEGYKLKYPQESEKIIMDWAKEHPVMTNADKFKEVFGIEVGNGYEKCDIFT